MTDPDITAVRNLIRWAGNGDSAEIDALAARLDRIEEAIKTMAAWLVEAQTGFGVDDYLGIVNILKPGDNPAAREAGSRKVDQ